MPGRHHPSPGLRGGAGWCDGWCAAGRDPRRGRVGPAPGAGRAGAIPGSLGRAGSALWWGGPRGRLGGLADGESLMCGIALLLDRSGAGIEPAGLVRMTATLARRGPDDEAYLLGDWATGEASLRGGAASAPGPALPGI